MKVEQTIEGKLVDGVLEFAPQPQTISFHLKDKIILKITKDGIWADPDVPTNDAARAIFDALEPMIRALK